MHGACCHAGDDPLVTCRKILCFKETLQFPPEAPHLSMAKRASLPAAAQTAIRRPRSPPASSGLPSGPERGEASSRGCRGEAGAAAPWCQAQSRPMSPPSDHVGTLSIGSIRLRAGMPLTELSPQLPRLSEEMMRLGQELQV